MIGWIVNMRMGVVLGKGFSWCFVLVGGFVVVVGVLLGCQMLEVVGLFD